MVEPLVDLAKMAQIARRDPEVMVVVVLAGIVWTILVGGSMVVVVGGILRRLHVVGYDNVLENAEEELVRKRGETDHCRKSLRG